jgi:AraC-like DNA-binding protein
MLDGVPADFGLVKYSSSRFRPAERIESWGSTISRTLLRVQIEPAPNAVFHARGAFRIFEALRFGTSTVAPHAAKRSRACVAQENDDLFLIINRNTAPIISFGSRQLVLAPGNACLLSCADPWDYSQSKYGRVLSIRMPRAGLCTYLSNIEGHIGELIEGDQSPMRLLLDYLESIDRTAVYSDPRLRNALASHIQDLVGLVLYAANDSNRFPVPTNLKAARERAMKDDLLRSFRDKNLSLDQIAAKHHMSRRTIQRLFEKAGTTFQDHLLALRLENAHRQILDPRCASQSIAKIADECGFGDISHFNHVFRRRFGTSPSKLRL